MAWRCVGFLTVHVLVVLLEPSSQTAFDQQCVDAFMDNAGKPWRDPPSNTRYLYVSRDQQNLIPPWKEFQRDSDGSSAISNAEPIKWIEQSSTCFYNFRVCGFKKGIQDNWLLSPFINVSQAESVSIDLTFTMAACDAQFVGQCQVIFDLYTYQTLDANINTSFVDQSTFTQHRISASIADGNTENKVTTNLDVTSGGLYVAFRDTGSCMVLNLVEVKSYVCPSIVSQLAQFPQTKSSTKTEVIDGQCIANAEAIVAPQHFCQPGGLWTVASGRGCECSPGYEVQNASCGACQPGFFKDSKGNMNCSSCPDNSFSLTTGSQQCTCHSGFDRTEEDSLSSACTTFPSKPLNVNATPINSTTVFVSWSPPLSNGGRSDLMYRISTKEGSTSPVKRMTSNTEAVVTGLSPFTTVEVVVSSVNGISLKRDLFLNSSSASVRMPEDRPSTPPSDVIAAVTGKRVAVSWSRPSQPNGIITTYRVRYFINGSDMAYTWDVDGTEESITRELSNGGDYLYQVRAATSVGAGVYSSPVSPSVGSESTSTTIIIIIVAAVLGTVIFIIVIVVLILWRRSRSQQSFETPFEQDMKKLRNKTYVDPSTYSSVDAAVLDNTQKISPDQVKLERGIGEGEFGEVYAGFLFLESDIKRRRKGKGKKMKVAVKALKAGASDKSRNDFLVEASIMGQFDHDNVLGLVGVVLEGPRVLILSEFMDKGSLDHYLEENDNRLEVKVQLKMAVDVSRGMDYLAGMGYIHRDLATRNILVNESLVCKVADFGLSREATDDNAYDVKTGGKIPMKWTAPEAVEYRKFTVASDVWSFGVLLWEVMSYAEHPYWDWTNHKVLEMVRRGYRLPCPMDCPQEVYAIMQMCWEKERTDRPKFNELATQLEAVMKTAKRPKGGGAPATVAAWLPELKMDRYINQFEEAGYVNVNQCAQLTDEVLANIGITIAGHRNKIIKSLDNYRRLGSLTT